MSQAVVTRPRIGSLFSGYGGLDLAVEHVFGGETVWFSEINESVGRVFAHHWPGAPNLGDITGIDWNTVAPIDILCGGFPCQDVSTVGKMAGLAPGTRSGLWAEMATAIDTLQPEYVVIENVRGLLSAPATRTPPEGTANDLCNPVAAIPRTATLRAAALRDLEPDPWGLGDQPARSLRALGAVLGDLADLRYDASWIGLPASDIGAPHPRFRIFILAHRTVQDPAGVGLRARRRNVGQGESTTRHHCTQPPDHRPREQTGQPAGGDLRTDRGALRRWGRFAPAIARWERITGRPAPAPAILNESTGPRPAPVFVEWLMGLDPGWVTAPKLGLTHTQQLTALGNGVLPAQAEAALRYLKRRQTDSSARADKDQPARR